VESVETYSIPCSSNRYKAEDEGKELDEKVNVDGTRHVAEAAKAVGATLVYVSTDYIFHLKDSVDHQSHRRLLF
jgi:dTDP-4-dehydrorhamnose reductase